MSISNKRFFFPQNGFAVYSVSNFYDQLLIIFDLCFEFKFQSHFKSRISNYSGAPVQINRKRSFRTFLHSMFVCRNERYSTVWAELECNHKFMLNVCRKVGETRMNANKRDWSLTTCLCETLAKTDYVMCFGGGSYTQACTQELRRNARVENTMREKCIDRFQSKKNEQKRAMNQNLFRKMSTFCNLIRFLFELYGWVKTNT